MSEIDAMTVSNEAVEAAADEYAKVYPDPSRDWMKHFVALNAAFTAALPFLARRAVSQSDEEAADAVLFGKELGIHTNDKERDLYTISVASLERAFATVRAEATLAGAAAERDALEETLTNMARGYCDGGWNGERHTIFKCIDAIRARK